MAVPLFDTHTPLAPAARRACTRSSPRSLDAGRFILGPEVAAFEARVRRLPRRAPRDRRRQRHRRADARAARARRRARATRSSCRRSRSTRRPRRSRRPARGPVFCDVDPETFCVTPETVRAALTPRTKAVIAVHLFGNVAPVAEIEALGVPVLEDAAQAAGSLARRRPPRRRARHDRDVLVLPVEEPRRVRRRRRGRHRATTSSPSACGCCASTARATRRRSSSSATTRASTSCRRRCCAFSSRTSTRGATAAAPAPRAYEEAGLGELVDAAACRRRRATRPGTCTSCATRSADELAAALKAAGIGRKAYYRVPDPPPARDARRTRDGVELPGDRRGSRARTSRSR